MNCYFNASNTLMYRIITILNNTIQYYVNKGFTEHFKRIVYSEVVYLEEKINKLDNIIICFAQQC